MSTKKLIVLFVIHELLLIIAGMGIAFRIENGATNGTLLFTVLAVLLIGLGWIMGGVNK